MRTLFLSLLILPLVAPESSGQAPVPGQDWVVPAGSTVVYDTSAGRETLGAESRHWRKALRPRAWRCGHRRSRGGTRGSVTPPKSRA